MFELVALHAADGDVHDVIIASVDHVDARDVGDNHAVGLLPLQPCILKVDVTHPPKLSLLHLRKLSLRLRREWRRRRGLCHWQALKTCGLRKREREKRRVAAVAMRACTTSRE